MNPQIFTYGVSKNLAVNGFTRAGYTFKGFHKDGTLIIDGSGKFQTGATSKMTGNDIKLDATFEANKYDFTLSVNNATSSNHALSGSVFYDGDLPKIQVPERQYNVSYNADGGTVSKTEDVINQKVNKVLKALSKAFNATLRA